jgi:hypothetical protein
MFKGSPSCVYVHVCWCPSAVCMYTCVGVLQLCVCTCVLVSFSCVYVHVCWCPSAVCMYMCVGVLIQLWTKLPIFTEPGMTNIHHPTPLKSSFKRLWCYARLTDTSLKTWIFSNIAVRTSNLVPQPTVIRTLSNNNMADMKTCDSGVTFT